MHNLTATDDIVALFTRSGIIAIKLNLNDLGGSAGFACQSPEHHIFTVKQAPEVGALGEACTPAYYFNLMAVMLQRRV
jgi:hypothetical protein